MNIAEGFEKALKAGTEARKQMRVASKKAFHKVLFLGIGITFAYWLLTLIASMIGASGSGGENQLFEDLPPHHSTALMFLCVAIIIILANLWFEQHQRLKLAEDNKEGFKAYQEVSNPWKITLVWIAYIATGLLALAPFWTADIVVRGGDWVETIFDTQAVTYQQVDGHENYRWYRRYQQLVPANQAVGTLRLAAVENHCLTFKGYSGSVGREIYAPKNQDDSTHVWQDLAWDKPIPIEAIFMRFKSLTGKTKGATLEDRYNKNFTSALIVVQWKKRKEGDCYGHNPEERAAF